MMILQIGTYIDDIDDEDVIDDEVVVVIIL